MSSLSYLPLGFCFSQPFSHQCNQADGGTGLIVRRLITLIFADWTGMTCLRHGSCPRSSIVSSACALFLWIPRGFSQRGRVPPYALNVPPYAYVWNSWAPSRSCKNREKSLFPISPRSRRSPTIPEIRRYIQGIRRDATALGEPTGNP